MTIMLGVFFFFFQVLFLGKSLIKHKQINILFSLLLQLRFLGHKKKVTLKALRSTEGFCVASSPPVVAFSPVIHDLLPALSFLEMEDGRRRFLPDGGPLLGQSVSASGGSCTSRVPKETWIKCNY